MPFRTGEVDRHGVPRKRLTAADVFHPFHGVNTTARPETLRERAKALAAALRPGDALSHTTAASLYGAPLPRTRDSRLHVTTIGRGDRMRRPGVAGHRAHRLPVAILGTLPVVQAEHTWLQLASILAHDDLVAVGDFLVTPRRRPAHAAISSIEALRSAIPMNVRGAGRARRAIEDVRVGAESRMETLLRLLLVRSGLPEPLVNPPMLIEGRILHPDLAYPQWRVVFEYEGDGHRADRAQWRLDISRRESFEAAGWRVVRVHAGDVLAEPQAFLARVCRILAQRRAV